MECWKIVLITYLSILVIEGVPYSNDVSDSDVKPHDEVDDTDSLRIDRPNYQGLLQKWRKTTTTRAPATTISPGSLADLNIRLAALQEQVNRLSDAIILEENQINVLANQLTNLNGLTQAILNAVIAQNG